MKKKLVIAAVCIALVMALGITGVVAYLTAQSDPVDNVFYLSDNVKITLDEQKVQKIEDLYVADPTTRVTENTYEAVYPGAIMPKDPIVHLQDGAADAYVRAKVTVSNGAKWLPILNADLEQAFHVLTRGTIGADWSITKAETDANDNVVYTLTYAKRLDLEDETTDRPKDTTPVFTEVQFPASFTYEQITTYFLKDSAGKLNFEVDVIAEAMQAEGFTDAAAAFATYDAQ